MSGRWSILAVLTFVRAAMGFQFQSVAAVSPALIEDFALSYAELGTLVGIYLVPGVFVALPGGVLGRRFGDKRVVCVGLATMTIGSAVMASSAAGTMLFASRTLTGCGAVLLNVLVTKMVVDWFEGREVVTALGVLITSWPLGIAAAMLSLPALAGRFGWPAAMLVTAALCAAGLFAVLVVYRPAGAAHRSPQGFGIALPGREFALAVVSGLVWTFYNMGFILILAFGPAWLVARGETATAASALMSVVSWVVIPAVPLGAWAAERLGRPTIIMSACFIAGALAISALPVAGTSVLLLVLTGLIFGPPGGLIMALPGTAVPPERRAVAMGVYFTCYYIGMGIVPTLAGLARDMTGSAAAPLHVAGAMLMLALAALASFRLLQIRPATAAPT